MIRLENNKGKMKVKLEGMPVVLHTELSELIVRACESLAEKMDMNPHDILFPAMGLMWEHMTEGWEDADSVYED